jgi:hypothetical protein
VGGKKKKKGKKGDPEPEPEPTKEPEPEPEPPKPEPVDEWGSFATVGEFNIGATHPGALTILTTR